MKKYFLILSVSLFLLTACTGKNTQEDNEFSTANENNYKSEENFLSDNNSMRKSSDRKEQSTHVEKENSNSEKEVSDSVNESENIEYDIPEEAKHFSTGSMVGDSVEFGPGLFEFTEDPHMYTYHGEDDYNIFAIKYRFTRTDGGEGLVASAENAPDYVFAVCQYDGIGFYESISTPDFYKDEYAPNNSPVNQDGITEESYKNYIIDDLDKPVYFILNKRKNNAPPNKQLRKKYDKDYVDINKSARGYIIFPEDARE